MKKAIRIKNAPDVWSKEEKMITVNFNDEKTKFNTNHRKEDKFFYGFKVINFGEKCFNGDYRESIDVRFYCTSSTIYCCLWINTDEIHTSGTGRAGGYGYDKRSSAFQEAIYNAGFTNFPGFGGSGDNRFALKTLCKLLKIKKYQIVEIYG